MAVKGACIIYQDINMQSGVVIGNGILWVFFWFGLMLLYTALDIALWRKIVPLQRKYLNLATIILCMSIFLVALTQLNHFKMNLFKNLSVQGILLAVGCAVLFYVILDKGFDPVFEKIFPTSEESYQETLQTLSKAPIVNLLQVSILAPLIEEILMRGYLLNGLSINYGTAIALFVSAFLFALLHFNMVQTLSAFICGIILGLLYLHTGSLFCCIIAHMGYNLLSYATMILPLCNKKQPVS